MTRLNRVYCASTSRRVREAFAVICDGNRKVILEPLSDTPKSRTVAQDPAFIIVQEAKFARKAEGESTFLVHFCPLLPFLLEIMQMFALFNAEKSHQRHFFAVIGPPPSIPLLLAA